MNLGAESATPQITHLLVSGYKSLYEKTRLDLGDLTILAGANSSGKSSAIEPLLLQKQTLDASTDPGALLIDGPNVSFTSFASQMLSRLSRETGDAIEVGVGTTTETTIVRYSKPDKVPVTIESMSVSWPDAVIDISENMAPTALTGQLSAQVLAHFDDVFDLFKKPNFVVTRFRCFLQLQVGSGRMSVTIPLLSSVARLAMQIQAIIHVPALRYNSERLQSVLASGSSFPGEFDDYAASVIYHWQQSKDERLKNVFDDLNRLGVADRVKAVPTSDVELSLRINRAPRSRDMVELEDVGFGVSQILPVLVALWVASPGQIVYIEEPESHLHPLAQYELASVLIQSAKRGVRVILETHSHVLLLGLQALVAAGQNESRSIRLHWFSRKHDGYSVVRSSEMSEAGTLGDWPVDFGDVSLMAERRYLEAYRQNKFGKT